MKTTLSRTLSLTALLALFSANAFAEREISCTANSHIVNEIRRIELRVDLPVNSPLPGTAQFVRGAGSDSLTALIYATQLSYSPSDGEEIFTWNESITGSVDGVSRTYDLELVKKDAAKKASAKWVLRASQTKQVGSTSCDPDESSCRTVKTVAFEAPIDCIDSYDSIAANPDSHKERCKADPYHCQY
jgi:hypothetical protein